MATKKTEQEKVDEQIEAGDWGDAIKAAGGGVFLTVRKRAKRGTIGAQLPLRLTEHMRLMVDEAAKVEDTTATEWIRGAIQQRLSAYQATTKHKRTKKR